MDFRAHVHLLPSATSLCAFTAETFVGAGLFVLK